MNNGYNSTPGGEHGVSVFYELDTDKFIEEYNKGTPLLLLGAKFKLALQSVLQVRDTLKLEKRGQVNGNSNRPVVVDKLDIHYNYICTYLSMTEALASLDKTQGHCYIQQSMLGGNIAYGFRWQRREYLENTDGTVYNTIYDKYEHKVLGKDLEFDRTGRLRAVGINYSVYVGKSVKNRCKQCGAYTGTEMCEACKRKIANEGNNRARLEYIKQMVSIGTSFEDIGKELGMSKDAVRMICNRHKIQYQKKNADISIIVIDTAGVQFKSTINELADYIVSISAGTCEKLGIRSRLRSVLDTNKTCHGFSIESNAGGCAEHISLSEYHNKYGNKLKIESQILVIFPDGSRYNSTVKEMAKYFVQAGYTKMDECSTRRKIKQNMKNGLKLFGCTFISLD